MLFLYGNSFVSFLHTFLVFVMAEFFMCFDIFFFSWAFMVLLNSLGG